MRQLIGTIVDHPVVGTAAPTLVTDGIDMLSFVGVTRSRLHNIYEVITGSARSVLWVMQKDVWYLYNDVRGDIVDGNLGGAVARTGNRVFAVEDIGVFSRVFIQAVGAGSVAIKVGNVIDVRD